VHLKVNYEYLFKPDLKKPLLVHKNLDTNIALVKLFPGVSLAFLRSVLTTPNLKAVVLETYGAGNCTTEAWFISLIKETINKGIPIINVTQCAGGSVIMGHYETSNQLKNIGVISGKDSSTEAAISKLMFMLGQNIAPKLFKPMYETSLRGEMS